MVFHSKEKNRGKDGKENSGEKNKVDGKKKKARNLSREGKKIRPKVVRIAPEKTDRKK